MVPSKKRVEFWLSTGVVLLLGAVVLGLGSQWPSVNHMFNADQSSERFSN